MKKIFNSIFVIIAAMVAFASCAKDEPAVSDDTKTVQFFAESVETKSAFGTPDGTKYPTLWTENDKEVKVLLNLNEETDAEVKVSDDFLSMSFSADIKLNADNPSSNPYQFAVISPKNAYLGKNSERFAVTIPTTQTPLVNSVDESAQILYAVSDSYDEMPSRVNLKFMHFTAYGKLSFTNLNLGDAKVNSVAITSSLPFANRWNYFVGTEKFEVNSGASTITLQTTETENLWFACAPVGSMDGKTLTFTINTDKGPLSKEVKLSGEKYNFTAGKIAKISVDMSGVEFANSNVYELVTNVEELTPESEIIIVASGFDQALSVTQNGNNRAQAAVTKSENTIKDPNGVQIITIEDGTKEGTLAFNVGNGYLYAASSSNNYLRTETELTDNSSWLVTIDGNGVATIKAQGTNTRNWLRYNSTNNPPIFSCYGSGQKDVSIYKLQGTGSTPLPKLVAPTVTAELGDDKTGINVSWTSVENATEYVISGVDEDITTTETSYSFESLEPGTYTISVKAIAEGYKPATGSASIIVPSAESGDEGGEGNSYTINVTFSEYTAGTQYAKNEEHKINEVLTLYTTECHFTSELRIYSSSTHNGYVVSNELPGKITNMTFNAGNKVDNLIIYGSTDGMTWINVGKVSITATSYKDYTFNFGDTNYTYFKIDVEGSNQVRLKKMSVTYQN